jgi:hypothetical protein
MKSVPASVHAAAWLGAALLAGPAAAQTITVVGTRHLATMETAPDPGQFAHAVNALSAFEPTQVCVERMSGERIERLAADPARHSVTLHPETHGRPFLPVTLQAAASLQPLLERRSAEARDEARELAGRWDELDGTSRIRVIGLQLAGFEFHSAALNWSYLDETEREKAAALLPQHVIDALEAALMSTHEVYSLGVALARQAGLHELCTADALEDETRGMQAALEHGGALILEDPAVLARFGELTSRWEAEWRPEAGPAALTAMLRFFNSEEYAELDRRLQWETLRQSDNEAGAFRRRLMYWHARTAEISAELFRALARGPDERVLFIVGAAHRPFTEADLRAQPWVEVVPAISLLDPE